MILRTTSENPDFQALVAELDAYLAQLNGEEHTFYNQFNVITALKHVVVFYDVDMPIACGAIKPFDDHTAEVKRMFVLPDRRGGGLAGEVLAELEAWSRELGCSATVLETANDMPDVIRLYEKHGYERTPNYGQYVGMPRSVCFRKVI
ncbi:MAG: GNAT family N-acetyltransferase [Cytophagales bacterium]|nr:MAG: GNAT family N-acetyltransferase [Cytophagales bacterium]